MEEIFMHNYKERKLMRLDSYLNELAIIPDEELFYAPISLVGFQEDEDGNNRYSSPNVIATQLLMCRKVVNIHKYSHAMGIEDLKSDLNATTKTQNTKGKKILIESIIELVECGLIILKFIGNDTNKYTDELLQNDKDKKLELTERIKNNEKFEFIQTLKYHNSKAMYFRFYGHAYKTITSEAFLDEARELIGTKTKGISIVFDLLAYYAVVANSMNTMNRDIVKDEDYKEYGSSVNFTSQTRLMQKTANNEKNRMNLKKVNQLDQILLKNNNIFTSVKIRHKDTKNFEWVIYRSHVHEVEALHGYIKYRLHDGKIFDILPYEYLNKHNEYRIKEYNQLEYLDEVHHDELEESRSDDESEVVIEHSVGFSGAKFEDKVFNPLEDKKIKKSTKKSLAGTRENNEDTKVHAIPIHYNENNDQSTRLIDKKLKQIRDPRDRILILKQVKKRCDDTKIAYPDTYELNLAEKNKDYSIINTLYEEHVKTGKIKEVDLQNSEIKNLDQKIGAFAAEQKVVRIYDKKPYSSQEIEFDKMISDLKNLIK